jgi:hypothetical protein
MMKMYSTGVVSNDITFIPNFMKISHEVKKKVATYHASVTSLLERKLGKKYHYMTSLS